MSRKKPTIAICYDFDGTLIKGNMQENSFLPKLGESKENFWKNVKENAEKHDMDEVLSYMQLMIETTHHKDRPFTKSALKKQGEGVNLFLGVKEWFNLINQYNKKVTIEHYIISSGIDEMIKGSPIGGKFKHIFASGFTYDANNVAKFPARSINYTTKVQYLFRINKGIYNSWDSSVNDFIPEPERPRPFSQMIYIGDGATDVPAMKMINYKGGYSIAVYPPIEGQRITKKEKEENKTEKVEDLQKNNRCQFIAEADYEKDKYLYKIVTMLIDRIVNQHELKMNLDAK